jgi:hypothetical protein
MIYTEDGGSIFPETLLPRRHTAAHSSNSDDFSMKGHTLPSVCGSDFIH